MQCRERGAGQELSSPPHGGGDSGPDVQLWTLARSWLLGGGSPGGCAKVLGSQEVRMFWVNFQRDHELSKKKTPQTRVPSVRWQGACSSNFLLHCRARESRGLCSQWRQAGSPTRSMARKGSKAKTPAGESWAPPTKTWLSRKGEQAPLVPDWRSEFRTLSVGGQGSSRRGEGDKERHKPSGCKGGAYLSSSTQTRAGPGPPGRAEPPEPPEPSWCHGSGIALILGRSSFKSSETVNNNLPSLAD